MRYASQRPTALLLALQSVESVGGRLALEAAVEALVQVHNTAGVEGYGLQPTLMSLQAACVELLQALPPNVIAGGAQSACMQHCSLHASLLPNQLAAPALRPSLSSDACRLPGPPKAGQRLRAQPVAAHRPAAA